MTWLCTSSNWSEYPEQKVVPSKASNLSNMQRSYSRFVDEIFFDMFRLIRWFAVESIEYGPLRNASQLSVSHVPCCLNLVFDQPLFGPTVPQCGGHGRAGGHRPRALAGASARLRSKATRTNLCFSLLVGFSKRHSFFSTATRVAYLYMSSNVWYEWDQARAVGRLLSFSCYQI